MPTPNNTPVDLVSSVPLSVVILPIPTTKTIQIKTFRTRHSSSSRGEQAGESAEYNDDTIVNTWLHTNVIKRDTLISIHYTSIPLSFFESETNITVVYEV